LAAACRCSRRVPVPDKTFRLKADITFTAEGIEDAMAKLSRYFGQLAEGADHIDLVESGQLRIGLLDDWSDDPARG
jgi:hypothetical protein